MSTITRETWDGLPDKAKWDVKVAMRGPDRHHSDVLKWFTTSVLRGHVREVFRVGGLVNNKFKHVYVGIGRTSFTEETRKELEQWNYNHFHSHITEAACWLNLPVVAVDLNVFIKAMNQETPMAAAKVILTDADPKWSPAVTTELTKQAKERAW